MASCLGPSTRPGDLQSAGKQERFRMRLFPMKSCPARVLFAQAGAALALAALIGGCGDNYRPVVTPIGTNGPPAQVQSYAIVVSTTGTSTPGVVTIIDYSGDSIMTEAAIGPGPRPSSLWIQPAPQVTRSIATERCPILPLAPICRPRTSRNPRCLPQRSRLTCFRHPMGFSQPTSTATWSISLTGRLRPLCSRSL